MSNLDPTTLTAVGGVIVSIIAALGTLFCTLLAGAAGFLLKAYIQMRQQRSSAVLAAQKQTDDINRADRKQAREDQLAVDQQALATYKEYADALRPRMEKMENDVREAIQKEAECRQRLAALEAKDAQHEKELGELRALVASLQTALQAAQNLGKAS